MILILLVDWAQRLAAHAPPMRFYEWHGHQAGQSIDASIVLRCYQLIGKSTRIKEKYASIQRLFVRNERRSVIFGHYNYPDEREHRSWFRLVRPYNVWPELIGHLAERASLSPMKMDMPFCPIARAMHAVRTRKRNEDRGKEKWVVGWWIIKRIKRKINKFYRLQVWRTLNSSHHAAFNIVWNDFRMHLSKFYYTFKATSILLLYLSPCVVLLSFFKAFECIETYQFSCDCHENPTCIQISLITIII